MEPKRTALTWLTLSALSLSAAVNCFAAASFRFAPVSTDSLGLWEGDKPVLVYNHGIIKKAGVPADRARSTYIHPLYGLDGEILTDDFPKDHYHHRGLFWAWPHVTTGGKHYDLWMLNGVAQKFERWLGREATSSNAVLKVQNGWYAGDRKIMDERVTISVHPATQDARAIDLDFTWTPQDEAVTLAGAEGKSYGGLTLRFSPRTKTVITTPLGIDEKDLPMTRLAWADLTAQYPGVEQPTGAAIFVSKTHPDFPPMWLTRHYGVLCLGWPGVEPMTFPAGKPIRCQYRVWIHKGNVDGAVLQKAYDAYTPLP
ncbi:MAG TPA: DUF6807 family protein [Clostridia bacterium]|nr:DUF6807 family protein [Clostridia bacterium]